MLKAINFSKENFDELRMCEFVNWSINGVIRNRLLEAIQTKVIASNLLTTDAHDEVDNGQFVS